MITGNISLYAEWKAVVAPAPLPETIPKAPPLVTLETQVQEIIEPGTVPDEEPIQNEQNTDPAAAASPDPVPAEQINTVATLAYNQAPSPAMVLSMLINEGVPILALGSQQVPLFASSGLPVWAPLNLILASIGVVLAVSAILGAVKSGRRRFAAAKQMMITIAALGAAGIILFILTQDMRHLTVLFDRWTIVTALIFVAEIIAFKKIKERVKYMYY